MKPVVFAFHGCASLAAGVRAGLGADSGGLAWRHFPDGESLVRLDTDCAGRDVSIVATLRDPDNLAMPLLFAARTARELGARSVGLVAPYLAYLRQDTRFAAGEAVSSVHFAAFLSSMFDWMVTVDPHLHRRRALAELFTMSSEAVSSMPAVGAWVHAHVAAPVLVGPDAESAQWLAPLATGAGIPFTVLAKTRTGDRDVEISGIQPELLQDRTPVIFDDIIASGETMIRTVARLREAGARAPICIATHGLFACDADLWLRAAGAASIVTTNTIEHASNAIDVAPLVVAAIERQLSKLARA